MTDDPTDDEGDPEQPEGVRKDGKPFKQGNTRDDGSYEVGKNRAPAKHQFAKGDGRKRGKRPKGSKNLDGIWRKQLEKKRTINGRTQRTLEWVVEGTSNRAIAKSDRASEIVFAKAEQLERKKDRGLALSDREAIEAWLTQRAAEGAGEISDDADRTLAEGEPGELWDDDHADQ